MVNSKSTVRGQIFLSTGKDYITQHVASEGAVSEKLTLSQWIEKEGVEAVASILKVTPAAVRHWRRGWVLPNTELMKKIQLVSKGVVSFDKTLKTHKR